ncbi:MAG: ATP phosphoribosyltransferase regulatory subunit [Polyangiaceae bacterium]
MESPARSLEHPLPAGMRDLLPEEAAARRDLAAAMLRRFALHGYALVTPPAFEFAEVLERGLGTSDPADLLRFIEPESGEVAALRPDMTPQIARMIATRLRDRPWPCRLGYEGTVLRRRSGRARKHRQIPQVGVELAGVAGLVGDLELIGLVADSLRAAGLDRFAIDIGDVGVVRALLSESSLDESGRSHIAALTTALAQKDDAAISQACAAARAPYADALRALPSLHGGREALIEGAARLAKTPAHPAAMRLVALFDAAHAAGLDGHLTADLGEVRGFAYYTGTVFHAYAHGTGDAVVSGGRYDELLGRFGRGAPAAGFAVDLDRAREALESARFVASLPVRVVVVAAAGDRRVGALRDRGIAAVAMGDRDDALLWARTWGYTHVLDGDDWVDAASGVRVAPPSGVAGEEGDER